MVQGHSDQGLAWSLGLRVLGVRGSGDGVGGDVSMDTTRSSYLQ